MSGRNGSVISRFEPTSISLSGYITGFVTCVIITALAYLVATHQSFGRDGTIFVVGGLAIIQAVFQLVRFLHLGQEFKPRWKLAVFSVMVCVVLILVIGSLWIMDNLNYRMMSSPQQMNMYMQGQDGL